MLLKIPEFIAGLAVGFSIYVIIIGVIFLPEIDSGSALPPGNIYYELLFPYFTAVISGVALGYGLRADDGGYGGWSGGMGEQWPTLVGAVFLAISVGISVLLILSQTPLSGIIFAFSAIALVIIGSIIGFTNWETSGF